MCAAATRVDRVAVGPGRRAYASSGIQEREGVVMHSPGSLRRRLLAVAGVALAAAAVAAPSVGATGHRSTNAARPHDGQLPYQNAVLPVGQRVQDLLSRMTLAEKIGQMTQAERANVDIPPPNTGISKITTDLLGSVLSGGGSVPTPNTPEAWANSIPAAARLESASYA